MKNPAPGPACAIRESGREFRVVQARKKMQDKLKSVTLHEPRQTQSQKHKWLDFRVLFTHRLRHSLRSASTLPAHCGVRYGTHRPPTDHIARWTRRPGSRQRTGWATAQDKGRKAPPPHSRAVSVTCDGATPSAGAPQRTQLLSHTRTRHLTHNQRSWTHTRAQNEHGAFPVHRCPFFARKRAAHAGCPIRGRPGATARLLDTAPRSP